MFTPLFAALLALLLVVLSFRVLLMRRKLQVGVGHGGHLKLEKAAAAHSNFIEYTPIALILLYFYEINIGSTLALKVLCVVFLSGRIVHAYGNSQVNENYTFRVAGMVMTLGVIISASVRLLIGYV